MADQTTNSTNAATESKGKGRAPPQDVSMGEEEDSSEEEDDNVDEEGQGQHTVEEEDDDNMEEIDTDNIVSSRTRGKTVDWNKAAEQHKDELDDDEDDEDEDFEAPAEEDANA